MTCIARTVNHCSALSENDNDRADGITVTRISEEFGFNIMCGDTLHLILASRHQCFSIMDLVNDRKTISHIDPQTFITIECATLSETRLLQTFHCTQGAKQELLKRHQTPLHITEGLRADNCIERTVNWCTIFSQHVFERTELYRKNPPISFNLCWIPHCFNCDLDTLLKQHHVL